jgi:hypothetical protein
MSNRETEPRIDADRIRDILRDRFGIGDWVIERPHQGAKRVCAIATSPTMRVFVKLDVRVDVLERLGDLDIAPPVLAHGRAGAATYVVQAHIDGISPGREWLQGHIEEAGVLFGRWHADTRLATMLRPDAGGSFAAYMHDELSSLQRRLDRRREPVFLTRETREACRRLVAIPDEWDPVDLAPVHGEPNTSNMLVGRDGLRFVDWDEIRLADPLRDVGPFLWWYLPEREWGRFFEVAGHDWSEAIRDKVYWYAARASLDVALWHYESGHGSDRGFLADCIAAVKLRGNPRA